MHPGIPYRHCTIQGRNGSHHDHRHVEIPYRAACHAQGRPPGPLFLSAFSSSMYKSSLRFLRHEISWVQGVQDVSNPPYIEIFPKKTPIRDIGICPATPAPFYIYCQLKSAFLSCNPCTHIPDFFFLRSYPLFSNSKTKSALVRAYSPVLRQ